MKKLNVLTLKEAVSKLKNKEISHAELYGDINNAVDENNKELNVYLAVDKSAQKKAEKSLDLPLAGVPIAVKDNFLTKGLTTTASSNVLKSFVPPFDSTVVAKLQDAGGVVFGKTNMDAWAHGSSTETSDFGPTKNPRNTKHLPGGSSGGSAAAVAADMCIAAIGSETAGSIRQPAAWCGVVGLKPTYGRVSRAGVVAMASSTDSPGPLGKTVEDCAMILNHIAGKDELDATSGHEKVPDYTKRMKNGVKNMRVGICYTDIPGFSNLPFVKAVKNAGAVFERLGAKVTEIPYSENLEKQKIIRPDLAIPVYTIVQRAEVSSNLARYDGVRYGLGRSHMGDEAKRRIILGTFSLTKGYADRYYNHAQKVRELIIKNFQDLFQSYDILISAPSPGEALPIHASENDPLFGETQDMLVEPSSLAGLPGISVPCEMNSKTKLSLGLNIMSNYWQEETMIQAAYAYEQATEWNSWRKNNE